MGGGGGGRGGMDKGGGGKGEGVKDVLQTKHFGWEVIASELVEYYTIK